MPRPKSTGLPIQEAEQVRVNALLDVAGEAFRDLGFQAASTAEIARRAHASKQSFYARFPTKEKLFLAVLRRELEHITELFSAVLDVTAPIEQVLMEMGTHHLTTLLSSRHIAFLRIVYMEAHRFPEIARDFLDHGPGRGRKLLTAYMTEQMRLGVLEKDDPHFASQNFLALVVGDLVQRALLGLGVSYTRKNIAQRVEAVVELFLRAYATRQKRGSVKRFRS